MEPCFLRRRMRCQGLDDARAYVERRWGGIVMGYQQRILSKQLGITDRREIVQVTLATICERLRASMVANSEGLRQLSVLVAG